MCSHCWDTNAGIHHKDFIRGAGDDGFEETRYRKPHRDKPKKKRGCPENDYKAHVYLWVPLGQIYDWMTEDEFFKEHGFYRREALVCCGCGVRKKIRYSEEFQKLIAKKGWYRANHG